MAECSFCNTTFKSQYLLNHHVKTAKYCLKIQLEKNESKLEHKEYTCEYCKKKFTQLGNLKIHYSSCNEKKIVEIKQELTLHYEEKLNKEKEQLSKEYEDTINCLKSELEKQKNHYETIIIIDRNKYDTEIKLNNKTIQELKHELVIVRNAKEKLLISKSSSITPLPVTQNNVTNNITNTINVNQVIGAIDMSQERFDQIVSEKLTYDLFQKGSYAGKQLLVDYFTDELGILRIELCDDARNKLKIIDKETGRTKFIDHLTLFGKFSNSNTLHAYLQDHKTKYCNSNNYTVQGGIQMTKRVLSFQEEKRFTNTVYKYFKSHVREFGQLVTLSESLSHPPQLNQLFDE